MKQNFNSYQEIISKFQENGLLVLTGEEPIESNLDKYINFIEELSFKPNIALEFKLTPNEELYDVNGIKLDNKILNYFRKYGEENPNTELIFLLESFDYAEGQDPIQNSFNTFCKKFRKPTLLILSEKSADTEFTKSNNIYNKSSLAYHIKQNYGDFPVYKLP